jgi:hypothetical protein
MQDYQILKIASFNEVLKACNHNENDALILIDILEEGWYVPENEFFPVHYDDLEELTNVPRIKYAQIFNRLESRFGLQQKSTSCDPDRESFIRLAFNLDEIINLIQLYCYV